MKKNKFWINMKGFQVFVEVDENENKVLILARTNDLEQVISSTIYISEKYGKLQFSEEE